MSLCQADIVYGLLSDRVKLLAYIRTLVVDRDVAEDIHQEVIVQALQKAGAIEDRQHLLAWARRTAKLKSFEYLRKKRRNPQQLDPDVLDFLEPIWDQESGSRQQARSTALTACLGELTPRSKELLRLRFIDHRSGSEMSQILGLKLQSVYMALSRIYHALERCVRQRLAEIV